ncbi:MAG: DUF5326 family protein, partial [Streptomyces sp.]
IAVAVFGGLIASVVGFLIGLLFKLLIFAALIGGLVYVVRHFTAASSDSRESRESRDSRDGW